MASGWPGRVVVSKVANPALCTPPLPSGLTVHTTGPPVFCSIPAMYTMFATSCQPIAMGRPGKGTVSMICTLLSSTDRPPVTGPCSMSFGSGPTGTQTWPLSPLPRTSTGPTGGDGSGIRPSLPSTVVSSLSVAPSRTTRPLRAGSVGGR